MSSPTDPAAAPAHSPGKLIGGTAQRIPKVIAGFELIEKLGQGGMGAVFKARQVSMDRLVALKLLPPKFAQNTKFIERFQREARASARITHPNVVQGIDVGRDEASGLWYFAMELVEGESLRDVLKREKHLEEKQALAIAKDVAAGLDAAHRAGLVHRDIKPDNIMLTPTGAKILDLGLAKQIQSDDAELTQTGASIGTPLYMAPEQVRGQLDQIDTRTDLYALGATLFHLLTGRPPFIGATNAVILAKHLTEPPPRADRAHPGVSKGAADLVARLLHKDQARRPANPAAVVDAIEALLGGRRSSPGHRPPTAVNRHPPGTDRVAARPVPWMALAAVVAVAVLGLGGWLVLGESPARSPNSEVPDPASAQAPPVASVPPANVRAAGKKAELAEQLSVARSWHAANPVKADEAVGRYRKIMAAAAGTPYELEFTDAAQAAIAAINERRQAEADAAFSEIATRAKTQADRGDIDGAIAVCADLPPASAAMLGQRAKSLAGELKAAAEARINAVRSAVEQALAEDRPDVGAGEVESLAKMRYAPAGAAVAELRVKLADVGSRRLAGLLDRFDAALLKSGDSAAARAIADEAGKDPVLVNRSSTVQAMQALAAAAAAVLAATEEADAAIRKGLIGTTVPLKGGGEGEVVSIEGDLATVRYRIEVSDGVVAESQRKIPWADLPNPIAIAAAEPADDAGRVAAALVRVRAGAAADLAAADSLLAASAAFPLTERYQQVVLVLRLGAAEAAAVYAWKPLAERLANLRQITAGEAPAVLAQLDGFLTRHGSTRAAAGHATDIDSLRQACAAALGRPAPPMPITGPVTVVVWNSHNAHHKDTKIERFDLVASCAGVETWRKEAVAIPWSGDSDQRVEVPIPAGVRFDELLLAKFNDGSSNVYASLSEVQVTSAKVANLLVGWTVQVSSSYSQQWSGEKLLDGITTSAQFGKGYWVSRPKEGPPWVRLSAAPAAVANPSGRFTVIDEPLTWEQARQRCEQLGGRLAVFDDPTDLAEAMRAVETSPSGDWWIGGRGEPGGYHWLDGRKLESTSWLPFSADENPARSAVRLNRKNTGVLLDRSSEDRFPCLCERLVKLPNAVKTVSKRFRLVSEPLSWDDARRRAEALGGRLAVLTTADDLRLAAEVILASNGFMPWVGAQIAAGQRGPAWIDGRPLIGIPPMSPVAMTKGVRFHAAQRGFKVDEPQSRALFLMEFPQP